MGSHSENLQTKWSLLLRQSHLVAVPAVGHGGPQPFHTHHLQHVLVGGVRGHRVVVWQLVVLHDT